MVVKYVTQNDTAIENSDYKKATGWLTFAPGDQHKVVPVTLLRELSATKRFSVIAGWTQNHPPLGTTKGVAYVSGDPATVTPIVQATSKGFPSIPTGLREVFFDDFSPFEANDAGRAADGVTPVWLSRLQHGRTQPGNKELGYYADPVINPGTTPWFHDANGKLVLQAEYWPEGVKDANGVAIQCPWDTVNGLFRFSSVMITTEKLYAAILPGHYCEARMTMPLQEGSWPAFWLLPKDGSWPSIELDMFEGFFANPGTPDQVGTSVHWKTSTGTHASFGLRLPHLGLDLTQPHTWGVYWGTDAVTFYLDDVPYHSVPNVFPSKPSYLLIDIAVGGQAGEPASPEVNFPARMVLDWIRIKKAP